MTSTRSQPPKHPRLVTETSENASDIRSVNKSPLTSYQEQQSTPSCNFALSPEQNYSSQLSCSPQSTYQKRTESKMSPRQQYRECIYRLCPLLSAVEKLITCSDQAKSTKVIRDISGVIRLINHATVVVAVAAAVPEDGSRFMFITINALPFIAL
jgi:hypothetical protein